MEVQEAASFCSVVFVKGFLDQFDKVLRGEGVDFFLERRPIGEAVFASD